MTRQRTPLWLVKTRCAVVGAALAVTFGLGGLDFASATVVTGVRNVFVPVVPCRLFDTRPAPSTVGARSTPILKDEQFQVAVRGPQGKCNVSSGATAVVLNVTALDAKGDGFLTVWPAENPLPNTSNLNFSNGQAPVANAVTVKIDSQGAIKFASSARSLNVIADVVGFFEDHNHADAYKPGGTVLGTSVVPTVPSTTTTIAAPVYDVPANGDSVANGDRLRAFVNSSSNRTVTVAPGDFYIGTTALVIPPSVTLKGASRYTTNIVGDIPLDNPSTGLPQYLPIIVLQKDAILTDVGVGGTGRGAAVQADTIQGFTAKITNVSIGVSVNNGAVYNPGFGNLLMTDVRTRSGFGVNNGSPGGAETGSILIQGHSDIDGVVQNAAGGTISVMQSDIGLSGPAPITGATAYQTGRILLTDVTVHSLVGTEAAGVSAYVYVQGGTILSQFPRQTAPRNNGTTICNSVAKPSPPGGFFSGTCT
jgi:hypothetical protein